MRTFPAGGNLLPLFSEWQERYFLCRQASVQAKGIRLAAGAKQLSFNGKMARRAAYLFFPVAILSLVFLYAIYQIDRDTAMESLNSQQAVVVKQQAKYFTGEFHSIISDLFAQANHADFIDMLNRSGSKHERAMHIRNVAAEFLAFVDYKGIYDQLRYLDSSGQEIIRVDFNHGQPQIVPEDRLQNKGSRYYFKQAASLEKDQIYISSFDLNVEHGVIEKPLKPILRFAIPVFDQAGARRGIIILNYLGGHLLNNLEGMRTKALGHTMVLNTDGYWLKGTNPSDEWGFMFPNRKSRTFQVRYPDEWKSISANDGGMLLTAHGLFAYATVKPLAHGWKSASGRYEVRMPDGREADASHYSWKIISFVPPSQLHASGSRLRDQLILLGVIALLLWGLYSLLAAKTAVEKKIAAGVLAERDAQIRGIFESAFDGIITIDENAVIGSFNPAASEIFGYSPDEIVGKNISMLTPSPHREMHDDYIRHYIETGEAHIIGSAREVEAVRKDGSSFPLSLCVGAKSYGDRWMFTGIVRDITERKKMETELKKMATTDALTGLYNRGYFNGILENECRRALRYGVALSLVILDVDHFKRINDTYGHIAGDAVLIHLASVLREACRDIDIVARYGGEEFVIILPQTYGENAILMAERLRAAVENAQVPFEGAVLSMTISLGVASMPEVKAETADHFLTIADRALYKAKYSGRNRVVKGAD